MFVQLSAHFQNDFPAVAAIVADAATPAAPAGPMPTRSLLPFFSLLCICKICVDIGVAIVNVFVCAPVPVPD